MYPKIQETTKQDRNGNLIYFVLFSDTNYRYLCNDKIFYTLNSAVRGY